MVTTDVNGLNTELSAVVLDDRQMRRAGFTDIRPDAWYLCAEVGDEITLNISIDKDTSALEIDVLDEAFLQPYDYQDVLRLIPDFKIALGVKQRVEAHLAFLSGFGIINGFMPDMYV